MTYHSTFISCRASAASRIVLLGLLVAVGCNSNSSTAIGPPALVVKTGGDGQSWYYNNPLPRVFGVVVLDANSTQIPNAAVEWAIVTGSGGSLSPTVDSTNAQGAATTQLTLGGASLYVVTATVSGLSPVTFTANATAPPVRDSVAVKDNVFQPDSVVLQVNDTVYWTWAGVQQHNVTFSSGPSSSTQSSGTFNRQFTAVGTFPYSCTLHAGMKGVVVVVN